MPACCTVPPRTAGLDSSLWVGRGVLEGVKGNPFEEFRSPPSDRTERPILTHGGSTVHGTSTRIGVAASRFGAQNPAVKESNGLQTSLTSPESKPSKESITTKEFMQSEKADYLTGSGPTNSFAKSLQHAETLLWNRFQPGWKWLMAKHQAEDSCSDTDSDDSLLTRELDNRFTSGKLAEAERIAFDLGKCCQLQRCLKGGLFHGHVKSLPSDILNTTDFHYHRTISSLANNYAKLHILLERRSCILLNKEYAISVSSASKFVRKLMELLTQDQETSKKVGLSKDHSSAVSVKRLGHLCEELRYHTSHWNCLSEKIKNDPWLNYQLIHMKETFNHMKQALTLLGMDALFLMEQYISTVLCTLANADPYILPSEWLWEFFRGLEIFNSIVADSSMRQLYLEMKNSIEEINVNETDLQSQRLKVMLCCKSWNWKVEPFLIERVLRILANERGRIAAQCFYGVIMTNATFLSTLNNNNLAGLNWENMKLSFIQSFTGNHNVFCSEEKGIHLCREDKQQELEPCNCKSAIQEFCLEDEVLLNRIVDGLATSNVLWQHVLNRPKPEIPQEAKAEDLQFQHTTFSAEEKFQSLKDRQNDETGQHPSIPPVRRKSVHWQDSSHCEGKVVLLSKYQVMMWKAFATHLSDSFYFQPGLSSEACKYSVGKLDQCKAQITALLIQTLHEACYKGLLPRDSEPFVQELCLYMLSRIALIHWDQVFCSALGSALNDKCFPDPERKGDTVRSKTAGLFLKLFHPLCELLTWLNVEQAQNHGATTGVVRKLVVPSILVRTVSHCITTVQTSSHWLMMKGFQFLSSWSMNQFLLVIQADLKLLRVMASKMLQLAETLCFEEINSYEIQETLPLVQVSALLKELANVAAIFNTFPIKVLTLFSTSCKRMAIDLFEQTMPVGRQWRVNFRSVELPSKPNEYAMAATQTVIGQVLKGIQPLPEDDQTVPLTEALTAFMEAWMDHILKQKIKFSIQGALQLKQDFDLVRDIICSDEQLSSELRQAVLSLRVFHQVDNAIICLLQQPTRKAYFPTNTCEPFRTCCSSSTRTVDFSHGSLNSLDSLDLRTERIRADFQPEASTGSDVLNKIKATGHPESYLAMNQQEWLALRMDSNRRRNVFRLPCINTTAEQ
ncbi:uncharacterized protein ccdc142 isoform X3 [Stegostoma tigrinum]|uniref:uncharacterized protein ccdc142 isoform X3 n=1 Tax=Stegostoma tigrinum TaxID=3053191 RepID=UPI00287051E4|nr:uncharacterized protein ccdc142 isoform X3 [Stegostoma tigrinum]